jgi:DNA-binding LacI/PurR family transcriptional regulator
VTGRSAHLVGVLQFGRPFFGPAQTLWGIETAARRAGYSVTVVHLATSAPPIVAAAAEHLLAQHVDGVVAALPTVSAGLEQNLHALVTQVQVRQATPAVVELPPQIVDRSCSRAPSH